MTQLYFLALGWYLRKSSTCSFTFYLIKRGKSPRKIKEELWKETSFDILTVPSCLSSLPFSIYIPISVLQLSTDTQIPVAKGNDSFSAFHWHNKCYTKKVACKPMGNYLINYEIQKYDMIHKMYISDLLSRNLKCINSCLPGS